MRKQILRFEVHVPTDELEEYYIRAAENGITDPTVQLNRIATAAVRDGVRTIGLPALQDKDFNNVGSL